MTPTKNFNYFPRDQVKKWANQLYLDLRIPHNFREWLFSLPLDVPCGIAKDGTQCLIQKYLAVHFPSLDVIAHAEMLSTNMGRAFHYHAIVYTGRYGLAPHPLWVKSFISVLDRQFSSIPTSDNDRLIWPQLAQNVFEIVTDPANRWLSDDALKQLVPPLSKINVPTD